MTEVPDGYYCNDISAKTIAKCNIKCSKCDKYSHDLGKWLFCNNNKNYYGLYNESKNDYKSSYSMSLWLIKLNKLFLKFYKIYEFFFGYKKK